MALGADSGKERVVKGGNVEFMADKITIYSRAKANPAEKNTFIGFRVVLSNVKR